MRKRITVALAAAALLMSAVATQAGSDFRKRITLFVTAAGAQIDASGTAEVRASGTQQRFKVSMDARVADGTTFAVFANDNLAGTITIVLGDGELELNNNNENILPAGVDPVSGIKSVEVKDGSGTLILSGSF